MGKRIVTSWNQKLAAYDGASKVFEFDCVLGDRITPTRIGHFRIKWKDLNHISGQSGHPMPYSMFFDEGRAIHGGIDIGVRHLAMRTGLGRLDSIIPESMKIGSHGCVNLTRENAKRLYEWATDRHARRSSISQHIIFKSARYPLMRVSVDACSDGFFRVDFGHDLGTLEKQAAKPNKISKIAGGGRGIRTPDTLSGIAVFKTACFNRSHIPPRLISRLLTSLYDNQDLLDPGSGCMFGAY